MSFVLRRSRSLATAVVGLLALTVAACSDPSSSSQGEDSRPAIVIGAGSEPDSLNPILGYAPNGASKFFDGLVDLDADLELRPALAAELPTVSADGLVWTADLRPGVKFHDGSALTAQDVVYTFTSIGDPDVESTIAADFEALESVRAVDDDTVEFRLKYPYQPWGQRLALGIVPEKLLEGTDLNTSAFNSAPVGTGPYELVDWRKGERMVLRANEDYYRGAPEIKDVTIVFAADDNARAQRMAAGEFDITVLPPKLAATYADRPGIRTVASQSADYRAVGLPDTEFAGDPQVRRAINLGIDRQAMVDSILAGAGIAAATPISPYLDVHDPDATFTFDPAEAGRLLDAAGWPKGTDGVRRKGATVAELTILYPGEDVLRKELTLATASDLTKLGIDARANSATFDQMLEQRATTAGLWAGGDPYDPDTAAYTLLHSRFADAGGYVNMTGYSDPAVDAALDAGRESQDAAARTAAYQDFQQAFVADPGWAFLVFLDHTYVMKDAYDGLQPQIEPHDHGLVHGPWWNLEEWSPKDSAS